MCNPFGIHHNMNCSSSIENHNPGDEQVKECKRQTNRQFWFWFLLLFCFVSLFVAQCFADNLLSYIIRNIIFLSIEFYDWIASIPIPLSSHYSPNCFFLIKLRFWRMKSKLSTVRQFDIASALRYCAQSVHFINKQIKLDQNKCMSIQLIVSLSN